MEIKNVACLIWINKFPKLEHQIASHSYITDANYMEVSRKNGTKKQLQMEWGEMVTTAMDDRWKNAGEEGNEREDQ